MSLLYHAYVYLEFLILACTIYILAPTTFIAYGADLTLSKLADDDEKLVNWYKGKGLTKKGYYLVVGRFVPENSFEVMIREFMKSKSKKNFISRAIRELSLLALFTSKSY